MAAARAAGEVTPGLRAAWADPAVAMARRYELVTIVIIVAAQRSDQPRRVHDAVPH